MHILYCSIFLNNTGLMQIPRTVSATLNNGRPFPSALYEILQKDATLIVEIILFTCTMTLRFLLGSEN